MVSENESVASVYTDEDYFYAEDIIYVNPEYEELEEERALRDFIIRTIRPRERSETPLSSMMSSVSSNSSETGQILNQNLFAIETSHSEGLDLMSPPTSSSSNSSSGASSRDSTSPDAEQVLNESSLAGTTLHSKVSEIASPAASLSSRSTPPETPLKDPHEILAAFLAAAHERPELHPDCALTQDGPLLTSLTTGGIVINQLRRVLAGMKGEQLEIDRDLMIRSDPEGEDRDWSDRCDTRSDSSLRENISVRLENDGHRLPASDDARLDHLIATHARKSREESMGNDSDYLTDRNPAKSSNWRLETYQQQMAHQGNDDNLQNFSMLESNYVGPVSRVPEIQVVGEKRSHDKENEDVNGESRKRAKIDTESSKTETKNSSIAHSQHRANGVTPNVPQSETIPQSNQDQRGREASKQEIPVQPPNSRDEKRETTLNPEYHSDSSGDSPRSGNDRTSSSTTSSPHMQRTSSAEIPVSPVRSILKRQAGHSEHRQRQSSSPVSVKRVTIQTPSNGVLEDETSDRNSNNTVRLPSEDVPTPSIETSPNAEFAIHPEPVNGGFTSGVNEERRVRKAEKSGARKRKQANAAEKRAKAELSSEEAKSAAQVERKARKRARREARRAQREKWAKEAKVALEAVMKLYKDATKLVEAQESSTDDSDSEPKSSGSSVEARGSANSAESSTEAEVFETAKKTLNEVRSKGPSNKKPRRKKNQAEANAVMEPQQNSAKQISDADNEKPSREEVSRMSNIGNPSKSSHESTQSDQQSQESTLEGAETPVPGKKRGRPVGSKNKPKPSSSQESAATPSTSAMTPMPRPVPLLGESSTASDMSSPMPKPRNKPGPKKGAVYKSKPGPKPGSQRKSKTAPDSSTPVPDSTPEPPAQLEPSSPKTTMKARAKPDPNPALHQTQKTTPDSSTPVPESTPNIPSSLPPQSTPDIPAQDGLESPKPKTKARAKPGPKPGSRRKPKAVDASTADSMSSQEPTSSEGAGRPTNKAHAAASASASALASDSQSTPEPNSSQASVKFEKYSDDWWQAKMEKEARRAVDWGYD